MVLAPALGGLALFALSTLIGIAAVRKLIQVAEARHELRIGSAGWIRTLSGWSMIAFWLMATWFAASVIGDWQVTGDLQGAADRAVVRFVILVELAAEIAASD